MRRRKKPRWALPGHIMTLLIAIHDGTYWPHRKALATALEEARDRRLVHPTMISLTVDGARRVRNHIYDTEVKPRKSIRPTTVYIQCSPPLLSYPII